MTKNTITFSECKELAEMLGIKPTLPQTEEEYEAGKLHYPNFLDPIYTLEQAVKMEDWSDFAKKAWLWEVSINSQVIPKVAVPIVYMLDKTGLLAKRLLDWMRERRKG